MPIIGGPYISAELARKENEGDDQFAQEMKEALERLAPFGTQAKRNFMAAQNPVWQGASDTEVETKFKEVYTKYVEAPGKPFLDRMGPNLFSPMGATTPRSLKDTLVSAGELGAGAGLTALGGPAGLGAGLTMMAQSPFASTETIGPDIGSAAVNALPGAGPLKALNRGGFVRQTLQGGGMGILDAITRKFLGDENASVGLGALVGGGAGAASVAIPEILGALGNDPIRAMARFYRQGSFKTGDLVSNLGKEATEAGITPSAIPWGSDSKVTQEELVRMIEQNPQLAAKLDKILKEPGIAYNEVAPTRLAGDETAEAIADAADTAATPVLAEPLQKRSFTVPEKQMPTTSMGVTPISLELPRAAIVEEAVSPGSFKSLGGAMETVRDYVTGKSQVQRAPGVVASKVGSNDPTKMYSNIKKGLSLEEEASAPFREAIQALDLMNEAVYSELKGADAIEAVIEKYKLRSNRKNISRVDLSSAAQELAVKSPLDEPTLEKLLDYGVRLGRTEGNLTKLVGAVTRDEDPLIRGLIEETRTPGAVSKEVIQEATPGKVAPNLRAMTEFNMKQAPANQKAFQRTVEANEGIAARNAFREEQDQITNLNRQKTYEAKVERAKAQALLRKAQGKNPLPDPGELTEPLRKPDGKFADAQAQLEGVLSVAKSQSEKEAIRNNVIKDLFAKVRQTDGSLNRDVIQNLETTGRAYLDTITGDPEVSGMITTLLRNENVLRAIGKGDKDTFWFSIKWLKNLATRFKTISAADPSRVVSKHVMPSTKQAESLKSALEQVQKMNAGKNVAAREATRTMEPDQRDTIFDEIRRKFIK